MQELKEVIKARLKAPCNTAAQCIIFIREIHP